MIHLACPISWPLRSNSALDRTAYWRRYAAFRSADAAGQRGR